jgi:phage shock protein A
MKWFLALRRLLSLPDEVVKLRQELEGSQQRAKLEYGSLQEQYAGLRERYTTLEGKFANLQKQHAVLGEQHVVGSIVKRQKNPAIY